MTGSERSNKHTPERTCVACRQKKAKWELLRIVRTPQGGLEIDPGGKMAGRGAYLCRLKECWEEGLKKKRLDRALKYQIASERRVELLTYAGTLIDNAEDSNVCGLRFTKGACG